MHHFKGLPSGSKFVHNFVNFRLQSSSDSVNSTDEFASLQTQESHISSQVLMTQALADHEVRPHDRSYGSRQASVEQMLNLAEHISPVDRALLRAVYERGMTAHAFATATRQSHSVVQARLRRIQKRLASPLFRFVLRHQRDWPPLRRAAAQAAILHGQPLRTVASLLGLSLYQVRRELDRVRTLFEESQPRNFDSETQR
jgi:hypothetical protein